VTKSALQLEGIDDRGLDEQDRGFLKTLIEVYGGGPAGIEALAATIGEEVDTLADVIEPYLLQTRWSHERAGPAGDETAYDHWGSNTFRRPSRWKNHLFLSEMSDQTLHIRSATADDASIIAISIFAWRWRRKSWRWTRARFFRGFGRSLPIGRAVNISSRKAGGMLWDA